MDIVKRPDPPSGLRRTLWRLPIHLYRLGLGRLLGSRVMLLIHVGRVSGKPRQAVIEVVERDGRGYVAASGFGPRADWYRNITKTPEVVLQVGGRTFPAVARLLPAEEGGEIMARYAPRHQAAARRLCAIMGFAVDGSVEDYLEVGRQIPFVRFVPQAMPAAAAAGARAGQRQAGH
ncbi:nitroreductase family deazaflavin-dependent oxidoreductase [Nonomuraea sp. C10]|uniref:nitroreductase family deazaflavin-dependent oxidoreductase n=1 Tax=Nonomuraea sp. C10 TaxID=2600577 RepID=UPI0011CE24FD|nr:nitroreductase family deazaflavin-dependent oxidoreductase [Nonomuraea sp. C10]TXK40019.1 nitroreductase family deazaflavin-dependent oxidoreductase [Nonomuraea sp. C10]